MKIKTAFDDDALDAIELSLSPQRLATYVKSTGGDRARALRLYTWNTDVSATFYQILQGFEITLRNALDRQLRAKYGENWYDNPACGLDGNALSRIGKAKSRRKPMHGIPTHKVADLSFGFWVSLLGRGGQATPPGTGRKNHEMTL